MKKIFFLTVVLISVLTISSVMAQDNKSRKEIQKERRQEKIQNIKTSIEDSTFVFNPDRAIPMSGGSIYLNHSYKVKIENDTINSYLPFFGVAYNLDYGGRNSGFDFVQPVENYKMKKDGEGYHITFEVKNRMDNLDFTFDISREGYATLNVISTNRRSISYYGTIEPAG